MDRENSQTWRMGWHWVKLSQSYFQSCLIRQAPRVHVAVFQHKYFLRDL